VIRLRLATVLTERGWTPYRLARETGLTVPTAYRLADASLSFGRFTADTLDRLCEALQVQPGELLEWVPETAARRKAKRDGSARRTSRTTRKPTGRSA
jgi:DNA-binding Xre family transcriptional regulator